MYVLNPPNSYQNTAQWCLKKQWKFISPRKENVVYLQQSLLKVTLNALKQEYQFTPHTCL